MPVVPKPPLDLLLSVSTNTKIILLVNNHFNFTNHGANWLGLILNCAILSPLFILVLFKAIALNFHSSRSPLYVESITPIELESIILKLLNVELLGTMFASKYLGNSIDNPKGINAESNDTVFCTVCIDGASNFTVSAAFKSIHSPFLYISILQDRSCSFTFIFILYILLIINILNNRS